MFCRKLCKSVWDTGYAAVPASCLQVPLERQKQGHAFVGKCLLSADEMKQECGLEEEVFKLLTAGEPLPWGSERGYVSRE